MKPRVLVRSAVAAAVISAVGAGAFSAGHWFPREASAATAPVAATMSAPAGALRPDFTGIVERNGPAVVNISVTHEVKAEAAAPQIQGLDPNSPFFEFFRQFP